MSEAAPSGELVRTPVIGKLARDVAWGDCDPAGIIYYPTYYRWIDTSTWNLFMTAGLTPKLLRAEYPGMDMPCVAASLEFKNPAPHGVKAEVRSYIEYWGSSSFRVRHEIVREDGAVLATGIETRAWVKVQPGGVLRAEPIPDSLKRRFTLPA